jgi:cobalt-zinc-cadmium efflux system outer membrane protein
MRTLLACAVMATLSATPSAAQSVLLTESQALERLSGESPRVRAMRAGIDIARADVLAAGRWPNPRFTFDRESVAHVTENIFMVTQPLPITGRRGLEIQAASAQVDATASRVDDSVRRARADLRLAFAQLVAAQRREAELTEARDRLGMLAEVLAKREAAGDAAGFDRLRAEREVLDVDADRAAAASDRARAQAALASFFAGPIEAALIVAAESSITPSPLPSAEALLERAEATRGELIALRREAEAAGFSLQAAQRRTVPEPEIVAGSKSSTAAGGDVGSVLTVHATIPLFDRATPERALAIARGRQADARAASFRLTLEAEIGSLRRVVMERRETASRYRGAALNTAGEMERIARVSYDEGERGILELLDAYRTGSSARVRQAMLDLSAREAEVELEVVSGWEIR